MSEIALEIAKATAAGDLQGLAAIAIDLAAQHAAAIAQLDEMRRADVERRRGAATRQQRRRGGGVTQPRDVAEDHGTSRDVTQRHVTDAAVTLPPLSPPDPPKPHAPTHTHPRARGATVSHGLLETTLGAGRMLDVEAYLDAIGARNRDGWYTELLRIVGPATGITADDLVQGVRDAMLITPIVNRPGPLRAFVLQCKHDRTRPPPPSSNGGGNGRRPAPPRPTQPYDTSANAAAARRLERDLGGDDPSSSTTTEPNAP